jgi:hypothetical protein
MNAKSNSSYKTAQHSEQESKDTGDRREDDEM